MSRIIGRSNSLRKSSLKLRQRGNTLALSVLLGLPLLTAYPQTVSVVMQQGPSPGAQAQVAYFPVNATADGARLPDLSSVDIPLLIRDSDRLGAAMHLRLPEYTYIQTRLSRELDQRGKMVERVSAYEAYPVKVLGTRRHVISLISEDRAPISPKRLKKEREQAAKEMETAERESALQVDGAPTADADKYVTAGIGVSQAGDGVWIGVSQFLRQCRFGAPRYDRLGDRDVIALDIHPCAGDVSDPRERYLTRMAGVVWIDAADKVVARLEAWPASETERTPPSTHPDAETLVYEQMRLPNGLWVPKRIRLNAIGKSTLFNGTDKDMTFEFSQYQRFNTEVKDLQQMTLKLKP
ncbi:MAG TPA: hypothetical protein VFV58_24710 [Blastocatellia bacterium]|nr:hypothetical protein [Blastocatellia bacterium]